VAAVVVFLLLFGMSRMPQGRWVWPRGGEGGECLRWHARAAATTAGVARCRRAVPLAPVWACVEIERMGCGEKRTYEAHVEDKGTHTSKNL